jgi:hypothetical protein
VSADNEVARAASYRQQAFIAAGRIKSPTRAREALMIAGAGGAMRATGWRATAIGGGIFKAGSSTSCSRFDISGWRDRGLYPLVQGRRGARGESTESMTCGGGHFVFAKIGAARPARAANFPVE